VTWLYVLVVLQTLLSGVFEPARGALLPDLVKPGELTAAVALSAASWSLMLAVGSAVGGLVTDLGGWQTALLVDAGTYLVSVAFLLGIREPVREPIRRVGPGGVLHWLGIRDLYEGARWMARRPRVWTLALVKPTWQVTGARTLILTLLGEGAFLIAGFPLLAVSLLYVARGVGTGLGPFLARWATRSDPVAMERALVLAFAGAGLGYIFVGLAPALWIALLMLVVAHLGGATIWVFSTVRLQQITPTAVRGRVFAAEHAGFVFMVAASNGVFGKLADELGVSGGAWLAPLAPTLDPLTLLPRALAVVLGVITLVPLVLWILRGLWLGWGGPQEDLTGVGDQ
jgi:MFS family permease